MHREGHLGAAMIAYAPIGGIVVAAGGEGLAIIGGGVAAGLSMLPDFDQRVPGIKHRGLTHTVHFAVTVGIVMGLAGAVLRSTGGGFVAVGLGVFGFIVGGITIASHIAADALTPAGVDPFRRGEQISYDVAKAANPIANYLLLGGGVVAVVIAYVLGTVVASIIPG